MPGLMHRWFDGYPQKDMLLCYLLISNGRLVFEGAGKSSGLSLAAIGERVKLLLFPALLVLDSVNDVRDEDNAHVCMRTRTELCCNRGGVMLCVYLVGQSSAYVLMGRAQRY